jgi:nitrile hydratase accessory protein
VEEVIPALKKPQKLPVIQSREEVLEFLNCVRSRKHRAILTTCYAAGLCISEAIALAVRLSAQGHFSWKEWAAALADELKAAVDRGEPDDGTHYYEHWLATLERLATARGLTDPEALRERKEDWADAYRHTPHGLPVELVATNRNKKSC